MILTKGSLVFSILIIFIFESSFSSTVGCSCIMELSLSGDVSDILSGEQSLAMASWANNKPSISYRVKRSASSAASGSAHGCIPSRH